MESVISLWARTWKKHSFLTDIKGVKIPLLTKDNALLFFLLWQLLKGLSYMGCSEQSTWAK